MRRFMTLEEIYNNLSSALAGDKTPYVEESFKQLRRYAFPSGVNPKKLVAVLPTTVITVDGLYYVQTWAGGATPDLTGVPHYINHPSTKELVEEWGAIPASEKVFRGLEVGESAVAVSIKPEKSGRLQHGYTTLHQTVCVDDLLIKFIERLE